jgi:hypothetical protein
MQKTFSKVLTKLLNEEDEMKVWDLDYPIRNGFLSLTDISGTQMGALANVRINKASNNNKSTFDFVMKYSLVCLYQIKPDQNFIQHFLTSPPSRYQQPLLVAVVLKPLIVRSRVECSTTVPMVLANHTNNINM